MSSQDFRPPNRRSGGRSSKPRASSPSRKSVQASTNSMLRMGCGAGFAGDWLDAALALAEDGALDYLVLECLAERTIALAQLRRRNDPRQGFDPRLQRRIEQLLPLLKHRGVRLVSNMGAANPIAAADTIVAIARR